MLTITKLFSFEAAHRISDYKGPCQQLHGHSYQLEVSVGTSEMLENDMVLDFKVLKRIVKQHIISLLDHCLVLKENEVNKQWAAVLDMPIFWMKDEPTAERMVLWIKDTLNDQLPYPVVLYKLRMYETATCFVEWVNPDNKYSK